MSEKGHQQLLAKIDLLEQQVQEVKEMAALVLAKKEWYSTAEVSAKENISKKTAANYCRDGTYSKTRKRNGRLEIHKSELNR